MLFDLFLLHSGREQMTKSTKSMSEIEESGTRKWKCESSFLRQNRCRSLLFLSCTFFKSFVVLSFNYTCSARSRKNISSRSSSVICDPWKRYREESWFYCLTGWAGLWWQSLDVNVKKRWRWRERERQSIEGLSMRCILSLSSFHLFHPQAIIEEIT